MDKVIEQIEKLIIKKVLTPRTQTNIKDWESFNDGLREAFDVVKEHLQKLMPTTPATSWEEVEKAAIKYSDEKVKGLEFGVDVAIVRLSAMLDYVSQHWPSSQPVSPTPMSETWEVVLKGFAKWMRDNRVNKSKIREGYWYYEGRQVDIGYTDHELVWQYMNSLPAPSLHQVDRWVRVEDGLPEIDKDLWIAVSDSDVLMTGRYDSHKGVFKRKLGGLQWHEILNVTHWQYEYIPIAPETDL